MPFLSDDWSLHQPGCPIRKSEDLSLLAAPSRVSSLGTSFLGTPPLGIPQTPYVSLDTSSHPTRIPSFHLDFPWEGRTRLPDPTRQQDPKEPIRSQEISSPSPKGEPAKPEPPPILERIDRETRAPRTPRKESRETTLNRKTSLKERSTVRTNCEQGLVCYFVLRFRFSVRDRKHTCL